MVFTRIKRGAIRTAILIKHKLASIPLVPLRTIVHTAGRQASFLLLSTMLVTAPLPVTAGSVSAEEAEPPLLVPSSSGTGANTYAAEIAFQPGASDPSELVVAVSAGAITGVQPGQSRADAQAAELAAEQARQAEAEAAAKAAAAQAARQTRKTRAVVQQVTEPAPIANLSPDEYHALFVKYFGEAAAVAEAVCRAESGLVPTKVSATHDYGVCQINQVHRGKVGGNLSALFDPETNIRVAAEIYHGNGGFHPWTMYRNKQYLKYL